MEQKKPGARPALTRVYAWFSALSTEDTDLMNDLLAHGVPVDVPHPLRHTTALMEATRLGRAAMVHWLLERGATPAFLCGLPLGTPLHCAIRLRDWAIASLLAVAIRDSGVADAYGRTPLHSLCMEQMEPDATREVLALAATLIGKNCPLEARDQEGITALHYCVINDSVDLAELLLIHGADPNALIPNTQVSPLAIAALERNLTMASLLLHYRADPYQPTRDGITPFAIFPAIRRLVEDGTAEDGQPLSAESDSPSNRIH